MSVVREPEAYLTLPLIKFTVRDLTDAIGVADAARLLKTSERVIYTTRNTNVMSEERFQALIEIIRRDEKMFRERLFIKRNMQKTRAEARVAAELGAQSV